MQHTLCDLIMKEYYLNGQDITQPPLLIKCAQQAGYDPKEVATFLARANGNREMEQRCAQIHHQVGFRGVPHITVGKHHVEGAAGSEWFVRAVIATAKGK